MSAIIDQIETVAAVDKRIQKLRTEERDVIAASVKIGAEYSAAKLEYEQDAIARARQGKPPSKAKPTTPDETIKRDALALLRVEIDEAIRDRFRAIIEAEGIVNEAAQEAAAALVAKAVEPIAVMDEVLNELRVSTAALQEVNDAKAALDSTRRSQDRCPPPPGLAELVAAATSGYDILAGFRKPKPRTLGLRRSNLHEPRGEAPEPPLLPPVEEVKVQLEPSRGGGFIGRGHL